MQTVSVCMKSQSLFSLKNNKKNIKLSSAEFAKRVVRMKKSHVIKYFNWDRHGSKHTL